VGAAAYNNLPAIGIPIPIYQRNNSKVCVYWIEKRELVFEEEELFLF